MATDGPGTPAGEYVCTVGECRRRWTHDGGPLRQVPFVDAFSHRPRSRWHPCPRCEDEHPALAAFAHGLGLRTADDLEPWGPAGPGLPGRTS